MVLDLILIGLAIALDPLPLTAFLVVLPSKRGVRKGAAFVFGWLVSLAIVVTVTVLATGNNPPKPNTAPSLAALAVKIAIGAGLVAIAIRHRRRMGRPKPPKKPPKWQAHVDSMSPWFAMGLAPTLQPWVLIGAGAATVVEAKLSSWESYLALVGFCVLASASYLAMEIYAGFRPGPEPGAAGQVPDLDRHPHRPGDHLGEPDPRLLAHRQQHLPDRHLRLPEIKEHYVDQRAARGPVRTGTSDANTHPSAAPQSWPTTRKSRDHNPTRTAGPRAFSRTAPVTQRYNVDGAPPRPRGPARPRRPAPPEPSGSPSSSMAVLKPCRSGPVEHARHNNPGTPRSFTEAAISPP